MKPFIIRNERIAIIFILCLHLAAGYKMMLPEIPRTHDGTNHIVRIAAYRKAVLDVHIPLTAWLLVLSWSIVSYMAGKTRV